MKADIVSKKMVKPSSSTTNRLKKLKITCIDQLQYQGYVAVLFFYRAASEHQERIMSEAVDRLEKSLSKALVIFYPLAGRYREDEFSVDCNDEGVEFNVATVDTRMDQLLQEKLSKEMLWGLLVYRPNLLGGPPLVSIQVNLFECGGLVISLCMTHMLADMHSISMFMKSWATLSHVENQEANIHPDFGSSSRFPMIESFKVGPPPLSMVKEKFVMDRFTFQAESLRNEFKASRVVMVSALICKALLNSVDRERYDKLSRSFTIFHAMNLRGRTASPVPQNYFGNMYANAIIKSTVDLRREVEVDSMVKLIQGGLRDAREKYSSVADDGELCSMIADSMKQLYDLCQNNEECLMVFSSWCGAQLQEIDFGWGRPKLMWTMGAPTRTTFLMDRSDGGVDAMISLAEDDMLLFKKDPDIIGLWY